MVTAQTIPVSVGVVEGEELFKSSAKLISETTSQTAPFAHAGDAECSMARKESNKLLVSA